MRGLSLSAGESELGISANASNPTSTPIKFGDINPAYPSYFTTFSPQRLLANVGPFNQIFLEWKVPGTTTKASVSAFGAVFTDVELANISSIEFFDMEFRSLGKYYVPEGRGLMGPAASA